MSKGIEIVESMNDKIKGCDKKKMKKAILIGIIGIIVSAMLLVSPVLANAGYSKIYGNANEDDVLDMRDVTYIKLVIFGKKPATTLADANYDGKISMLDIGQTKLIILGKEKQLTFIDQTDRTVTVPRPIERVVSLAPDATKAIVALGECDKLVGVSTSSKICLCYEYYDSPERAPICTASVCGGNLFELPEVRSSPTINEELIVSLEPDVIIPFAKDSTTLNVLQEKTGIPVVGLPAPGGYTLFEYGYNIIECMGTLLEKEEDAEEMISFVEGKLDKVREVTSQIPEEEKPKIYIVSRCEREVATTVLGYDPLDAAGGMNVAKGAGEAARDMSLKVSKEQIIAWNPDIILIFRRSLKTEVPITIESVLSDPDLQSVDAVKNESVYYSLTPHCSGKPLDRILANTMYLAKLLHPDKFEDLDVEEEGNEIYKRFLGVDSLFSEYADYTIWMREWLDSQK